MYIGQNTIDTTAPSDVRIKKDIQNTSLSVNQLMGLNVVDFRYSEDFTNDQSIHHGPDMSKTGIQF